MNKLKIVSALITTASMFSFLVPSVASAATSACNGLYDGRAVVASASWGCIAGVTAAYGNTEVVTYDVPGDGRCVDLYWRTGGSSFSFQDRNCTGGYKNTGYWYVSGTGSSSDFRIVRSDGAYYTTIYGLSPVSR